MKVGEAVRWPDVEVSSPRKLLDWSAMLKGTMRSKDPGLIRIIRKAAPQHSLHHLLHRPIRLRDQIRRCPSVSPPKHTHPHILSSKRSAHTCNADARTVLLRINIGAGARSGDHVAGAKGKVEEDVVDLLEVGIRHGGSNRFNGWFSFVFPSTFWVGGKGEAVEHPDEMELVGICRIAFLIS